MMRQYVSVRVCVCVCNCICVILVIYTGMCDFVTMAMYERVNVHVCVTLIVYTAVCNSRRVLST